MELIVKYYGNCMQILKKWMYYTEMQVKRLEALMVLIIKIYTVHMHLIMLYRIYSRSMIVFKLNDYVAL